MDTSWRLTSNLATFDLDNVFALVHRGMIKSLLQSWWKCKSNLQTGLFAFLKINYLKLFLWRSLTVKCVTSSPLILSFVFPWRGSLWDSRHRSPGQQMLLGPPHKWGETFKCTWESCKVSNQILIFAARKTKQSGIGNTIPILHGSKK